MTVRPLDIAARVIACLGILVTFGAVSAPPLPVDVMAPSVLLMATEGGVTHATGSGVTVANGYIITAAHVIIGEGQPEGGKVAVMDDEGKTHQATVERIDKVHDIAILHYDGWLSGPTASLACNAKVAVGDEVRVVGSPIDYGFVYTRGYVAQLKEIGSLGEFDHEWPEFMLLNVAVTNGNSGGPVFDADGNLIAIVVGQGIHPQLQSLVGIGVAVPIHVACDLLTYYGV